MRTTQPLLALLATISPTLTNAQGSSSLGVLTSNLLESLESRTDVGLFKSLLEDTPNLIDELLAPAPSKDLKSKGNVTFLVPDDDALAAFAADYPDREAVKAALRPVLSYHVMAGPLKGEDFAAAPRGLTIPTLLDGEDEGSEASYNLRKPAPALQERFGDGATGQVLFAQLGLDKVVRLRTRQDGGNAVLSELKSGLGLTTTMDVADGEWRGGVYQVVSSILQPPAPCSNTIRSLSDTLTSLDVALNKTDLWSTLNTASNVTCLAPSSAAFATAGSPEESLPEEELKAALLDHTLEGPTYTDFLYDGMIAKTVTGKSVKITLNDSGIWFNDARVVRENVLTNNGLVHILDKVMTVEGDSSSSDDSNDDTDDSNDGDGENGAGVFGVNGVVMGVLAFAAAAAVLV